MNLRKKIKQTIAMRWPVAVVALGALMTLAWIALLGWFSLRLLNFV